MLAGLVSKAGPTLNVPVPDSKDRNSEVPRDQFSDVLDSKTDRAPKKDEVVKTEPERTQKLSPDSVEKKSTRKEGRVESQDDSENQTEGPPDPKVMDPRTSALRAQRDRAIRKFMDSFEGEFGIPPEEMVEAMSQLTAQDLEKPPEKTVDHLIAKLDLAPQDELKAKKMYMGLVMQLKQIDVRAAMPQVHDDLLSQLSAQRVQLSAEKKSLMGSQVQSLSDRFWMRGSQEEKAVTPEMNQLQVKEFLKKMVTADPAVVDADAIKPDMMASTEDFMKKIEMEAPENSSNEEALEAFSGEEVSSTPAMAAMKALAGKAKAQDAGDQNQQDGSQSSNQEAMKPQLGAAAISKEAVQAEFRRLGLKPLEHPQNKKVEKADVEALLNLDASSLPQGRLESLNQALPGVNLQPSVEMSPSQKTENIQQIMNQAQVLLKNGGGEVKVEMSPEGMGAIQLKMQVLDGKVQLHMNTETKEAKKLIESSMNDLKQSLAAHQLSMDLVKVDVVHQASSSHHTQNDLQNQMQNFMNHQQREGTRQFWQQFNESFGNRQARDNFFDAQNIRSPVKDQVLPGFDRASSNGRARTDGRGKSLNLVA